MSSDNPLRLKLQAHVDSISAEVEGATTNVVRFTHSAQMTESVGRDAVRRQRQAVMTVSSKEGGLLALFHEHGGGEQALQWMLAECIGGIDEAITLGVRAQQDAAVSNKSRAMTLSFQKRKLLELLLEIPDAREPADVTQGISTALREEHHRRPVEDDAS